MPPSWLAAVERKVTKAQSHDIEIVLLIGRSRRRLRGHVQSVTIDPARRRDPDPKTSHLRSNLLVKLREHEEVVPLEQIADVMRPNPGASS